MPPAPEGWVYRNPADPTSKPLGYFGDDQILTEVLEGRLTAECLVWHARRTKGDWMPAGKFSVFSERFAAGERFRAAAAAREAQEREQEAESKLAQEAAMIEMVRVEREALRAEQDRREREEASDPRVLLARVEQLVHQVERLNRNTCWATQVARVNGALLSFAAFLFFASGAGYFANYSYDHPFRNDLALGWCMFGAAVFFVIWLFVISSSALDQSR